MAMEIRAAMRNFFLCMSFIFLLLVVPVSMDLAIRHKPKSLTYTLHPSGATTSSGSRHVHRHPSLFMPTLLGKDRPARIAGVSRRNATDPGSGRVIFGQIWVGNERNQKWTNRLDWHSFRLRCPSNSVSPPSRESHVKAAHNSGQSTELDSYVPVSLRKLGDLQTAIPAIAREEKLMREVEEAVRRLPTRHQLVVGDAREIQLEPNSENRCQTLLDDPGAPGPKAGQIRR